MMQLIELFREMDYHITFGSTASASEYSDSLETIGIEKISIQLNDSSFETQLAKISPNVVLFDRFMSEEQFGWRVRETCPHTMTILDTEDLHFLRKAREEAILKNKEIDLYTLLTQRELASILRCDLSLIISEVEYQLLVDTFHLRKSQLYYLPIYFSEVRKKQKLNFEERTHFVSLGNFLHNPNNDAVQWLKKSLWPSIRKQLPAVELHAYGAYNSSEIKSLHDPTNGFHIKGWASNKEQVITQSKVLLAPLRFGAGLKGKVLDAMYLGTPVLTSLIGMEGIDGSLPYDGVCTLNEKDICDKAIEMYTNESIWNRIRFQGRTIIETRFLKRQFEIDFKEKINQIRTRLEKHRLDHFMGQILHHESVQSKKFMSKWIELKNKS